MSKTKLTLTFVFLLPSLALAQKTHCELKSYSEHYDLWKCADRLKVLSLKGNPLRRAQTMGELLKSGDLSFAGLDYFESKVEHTVSQSPLPVKGIIQGAYFSYTEQSFRTVPESWLNEIKTLAEASGKSFAYFKRALALPDFGTAINGVMAAATNSLKDMGCTSLGLVDHQGRMSFGRNLDFSGVGVWDKAPLVVINQPEEGSADLKTLSFGMDGIHYASVTGLNERGIGLAVHLNYMRDGYQKVGLPLYFIGEQLLRKARTIEEAIEFLREHRPGPQWTFLLSDFNSQKIVAVEADKDRFLIREMTDGRFAQSNHTAFEEARRYESATKSFLRNSHIRKQIVEAKVTELQSQHYHPAELAEILSYSESAAGYLASHSDVVKAHTISTILWEGSRENGLDTIWTAVDEAPVSSGRYLGFTPKDLFSLRPGRGLSFRSMVPQSYSQGKRHEQQKMSEAYRRLTEELDPAGASEALAGQLSAESYLARAALLLKAKKYPESFAILNEAAAHIGDGSLQVLTVEMRESLAFLRMVLALRLKDTALATQIANEELARGVKSAYYAEAFTRVMDGKKPKHKKFTYDFFAGDIEPVPAGF